MDHSNDAINFLSESAKAAFLIKVRLESIRDNTQTPIFDNDILALAAISSGLTLMVDKINSCPMSVPADRN